MQWPVPASSDHIFSTNKETVNQPVVSRRNITGSARQAALLFDKIGKQLNLLAKGEYRTNNDIDTNATSLYFTLPEGAKIDQLLSLKQLEGCFVLPRRNKRAASVNNLTPQVGEIFEFTIPAFPAYRFSGCLTEAVYHPHVSRRAFLFSLSDVTTTYIYGD